MRAREDVGRTEPGLPAVLPIPVVYFAMSLAAPCPVGPKGRPAAVLALPPEDAWPPADTLITRRQLAELYGVTVEVIRAWGAAGRGRPRLPTSKEAIFYRLYTDVGKREFGWRIWALHRTQQSYSLPRHPPNPRSLTNAPSRPRCPPAPGSSKAKRSRMKRSSLGGG
jgi:hypothetical protein